VPQDSEHRQMSTTTSKYPPGPDGRWKLTVEDALVLADAIHDQECEMVLLPSTGDELRVFVSKNGCRRVVSSVCLQHSRWNC